MARSGRSARRHLARPWLVGVVVLGALALAAPSQAATPVTIGDGAGPANPYPAEYEWFGTDEIIDDITVRLADLAHNFPEELDIALAGPGGHTVVLMSDVGADPECASSDLTFKATATQLVPAFDLPCAGTYLPTDDDSDELDPDFFAFPAPAQPYGDSLAAFLGSRPTGTWRLFVVDDTADEGGSIADWRVQFHTRPLERVRFSQGTASSPDEVYSNETQPTASLELRRGNGSSGAPVQAGSVGWTAEPCAQTAGAPPVHQATAGQDFATTSGSVSFGAGQVEHGFDVALLDDRLPEETECVAVRLMSATGDARLDPATGLTAVIMIRNDDRPAARPSVASRRTQNVVRARAVTVRATSVADGTLSARGTIALPGNAAAKLRLRPATAPATAREPVPLKLRLTGKGLRAVKRAFRKKRVLVATINVTATDLAGGRATTAAKIRLRRVGARHG